MQPPGQQHAVAASAAVAVPRAVGAGAQGGARESKGLQEGAVQLLQVEGARGRCRLHKQQAHGWLEDTALCQHHGN